MQPEPAVPPPDHSPCRLCPRLCSADRLAGIPGACGESSLLRIASHGPHLGEEPCFSGSRGSGAIFFSGCSSHCFFCQNWQISRVRGIGQTVSPTEFLRIALSLVDRGVHNLNFVSPDHFWPHVESLCSQLRADGVQIPFLFNSSGYHLPSLVPRYASLMDVFLPDFKFADPALARAVLRDDRYPALALDSLRIMVAEKGFLHPFDPSGAETAKTGVLVRHLVLPGHVDNSLRVLDLLREEFGRFLPLSLMSQYKPTPAAENRPPFNRHLSPDEYQAALDHAQNLGFENLLVQPLAATDEFLPDFEREKPFRGNP